METNPADVSSGWNDFNTVKFLKSVNK